MPPGAPYASPGQMMCDWDGQKCITIYVIDESGQLRAFGDWGAYKAVGGDDNPNQWSYMVRMAPEDPTFKIFKANSGSVIKTPPLGRVCYQNNGPQACGPFDGHPINTPCTCSGWIGHWGF
jgi:hypothetical protein